MSLLEHELKRGAQTMDQYLHKQALSAAKIAEESRWEYIAMILLEKKQSVIMGIAVEQIKKTHNSVSSLRLFIAFLAA